MKLKTTRVKKWRFGALASIVITFGVGVATNAGAQDITVTFNLPSGTVSLGASQLFVHPDWANDFLAGSDVAIIELDDFAPIEADRYDIARVPLGFT